MQRIKSLDGLRGVAILLVIGFHYLNNQLIGAQAFYASLISRITYYGWVGVDLFFVLSGFLIGKIVINNVHKKNFFLHFYVRRILRIVPNYYLLLALFVLIRGSGKFDSNMFLVGHDVVPTWSYFLMVHNLFMAIDGMGVPSLSVSWSIGIEEQFYVFFPLIVFILPRKYLSIILVGSVLAAPAFRYIVGGHFPAAYVLPQCRIDGLALGIIAAWLTCRVDIKAWVTLHAFKLHVLWICIIFISGAVYYYYGDLWVFKHSVFSIIFFIVLLFALEGENPMARLLCNPFLVWIGKISYPLYLFHYIILGLIHYIFGHSTYIGIHSSRDVLISLVALLLSVFISWTLYYSVEAPLLRWGRRFSFS